MDTSLITTILLLVGVGVGYALGRGAGKTNAMRAVNRYRRKNPAPTQDLSGEQRDRFEKWLADLEDYVREDYRT